MFIPVFSVSIKSVLNVFTMENAMSVPFDDSWNNLCPYGIIMHTISIWILFIYLPEAFESRIDSKIDGKDRDGILVNQVQGGKSFAKLLIERCEEVKECLQRPK